MAIDDMAKDDMALKGGSITRGLYVVEKGQWVETATTASPPEPQTRCGFVVLVAMAGISLERRFLLDNKSYPAARVTKIKYVCTVHMCLHSRKVLENR